MWPCRVSNPGPLTYESGDLSTALRGPLFIKMKFEDICRKSYVQPIPHSVNKQEASYLTPKRLEKSCVCRDGMCIGINQIKA